MSDTPTIAPPALAGSSPTRDDIWWAYSRIYVKNPDYENATSMGRWLRKVGKTNPRMLIELLRATLAKEKDTGSGRMTDDGRDLAAFVERVKTLVEAAA